MTPNLSLTLISFSRDSAIDPEPLVDWVRAADKAGIDRLALSDHVAFGPDLAAYADPAKGGIAGGRQPTGPDGAWLEPLTTIAHLTAVTDRVRFTTNILLAALRRPVVLAKMAATIDVLSGGRLDLGVGVGWQAAEYAAAGLDFADRGRQLDHALDVCRSLWRGEPTSFSDERLEFGSVQQRPNPVQAGGVPIWVSGTINQRSMRRLARFGQGWIPWGEDAANLPESIPRMRAAVEAAGRDPAEIGVVATVPVAVDDDGSPDLAAAMGRVPELIEAGVTDVRAGLRVPAGAADAGERFDALVAAWRAAVG